MTGQITTLAARAQIDDRHRAAAAARTTTTSASRRRRGISAPRLTAIRRLRPRVA
jgi:hypothetical protein